MVERAGSKKGTAETRAIRDQVDYLLPNANKHAGMTASGKAVAAVPPQKLPAPLVEIVLAAIAFDASPEVADIARQLRPEQFDRGVQPIAGAALAYRAKYGRPPSEGELLAEMGKDGTSRSRRNYVTGLALTAACQNPAFVVDKVQHFVRRQALLTVVSEATNRFLIGTDDGIVADIERILQPALGAATPALTRRTTGLSLRDFVARPVPGIEPIMAPWLNVGTVHFIHGREGTMKTLLALHIAECLADCRPCLDDRWVPKDTTRVLFVDGELSPSEMKDRVRRLPIRQRLNLHIVSKLGALSDDEPIPLLYTPEGRARIDREIEAAGAQVVILDSLFTLFGAILEKELERWSADIHPWLDGHKAARRSIIIVHHEPKTSGSMFGSVLKSILADGSISLKEAGAATSDDPEERAIEIAFDKTRGFGGSAARPFIAFFRVYADGGYSWRTEEKTGGGIKSREAADEKRALIRARLAEGAKVADIAREAECTEPYVYKVRKEARRSESTSTNSPP